MPDSIIAYTMGGCRYPCGDIGDCSMVNRLSAVLEERTPFSWSSRVSGPDFSTMSMAYVPRETRKVDIRVKEAGQKTGEKIVKVEREFPVMGKAGILTVARVETSPGRPYCNVAAVLRGADNEYRSRAVQEMKEEGRRLEYTPHEGIMDVMVACSVEDCPSPCSRLDSCRLYNFMDGKIRELEKSMRGRQFSSFSVCEGEKAISSTVVERATAYGFLDAGGSTVLSLVKARSMVSEGKSCWEEGKPYCILMVGLHGKQEEERMIGTALRHILDTEGAGLGAIKLI